MKETVSDLGISYNPKEVYKSFCYYALKRFSILSKANPVFWMACVVPAELEPLMIFSWSFSICVYNSTIYFASNSLMISHWRVILISHKDISRFSWFNPSFAIHVLCFSEIKYLHLFAEISSGWNLFVNDACLWFFERMVKWFFQNAPQFFSCWINGFLWISRSNHGRNQSVGDVFWCFLCTLVASVRNPQLQTLQIWL